VENENKSETSASSFKSTINKFEDWVEAMTKKFFRKKNKMNQEAEIVSIDESDPKNHIGSIFMI
jgi:hypothetical protein